MSITERMKKYAEMVEPFAPSMDYTQLGKFAFMFSDLQATAQALEVAREALAECDEAMGYMSEYNIPPCMPDRTKKAISHIDKVLGKKE